MLLKSPTGKTEPSTSKSSSPPLSSKTASVKKVTNCSRRTSKTSALNFDRKRIQTEKLKRKISSSSSSPSPLITSRSTILLSSAFLLLLAFEAVHCQNFRPPFLQPPHVKPPPHHKNVFGKPFQQDRSGGNVNNNSNNGNSPPTGGGGPQTKPGPPPPPPPPPPLIGPTLPPNKNEEKDKKKRDGGEDPFSKKQQPGPPPPPPPPPPPNPQQRRQQLPQLPPHRPPHRPRNIRPPLGPHLPPHFQHQNNGPPKPPFPPRHLPRGHIIPPHGQGNNGNRGPPPPRDVGHPPPPPPPPHHKNPRNKIKATATISFPKGIGRIPLEEIANILHEKHIEAAPNQGPPSSSSSEEKNSSSELDQDFSPSREVVDELDQDIPSVLVPSSHFPNNFHSNSHDHHHHHHHESEGGENGGDDEDVGFKIEPRGQHSGPSLINRISASSFEENNGIDDGDDDDIERKDKLIKDALYFVQSNVRQADPYASAKNPRSLDLGLDDLHTSESRFHHHEHNHHSILSPGHLHHHDHNGLGEHTSHDEDDNGDKDDELYKHVKELVDCGGRDLGFCDMSSHYPGHMMGDLMSECKNLVYSGFVPVPEDLQELQEAKPVAKYSNASKSSVRAELGSWSWKPYEYEKKQMCESELKFIRPGYARDSTGKWQVIVQTPHLPQRVAIDLCTQPEQPCHLMSDCGRNSRCVQRYNFQHLLALDPDNLRRCPTLRAFKFPSSCLCHMEITDKGHGLF